jgi:cytochrome c556
MPFEELCRQAIVKGRQPWEAEILRALDQTIAGKSTKQLEFLLARARTLAGELSRAATKGGHNG